ncbi:MAG: YeiH family protein [Limisphaerales bacterium]
MPEVTTAAAPPKDYSWAEYLDFMEGGADILSVPPHAKEPQTKAAQAKQIPAPSPLPGFILSFAIMIAAIFLSEVPVWPFTITGSDGKPTHPIEAVMMALILGMVVSNVFTLPKSMNPGIKFSVKKILPLGIIFLGARLNFIEMLKEGATDACMAACETAIAFMLLLWLSKMFNLPRKLGLLLAVGTAICGGTAIVATAPVIEAEEKDVVFSVATVTLLGLIGMFLLPVLAHMMHMGNKGFGYWAGLSIHQTPQVIASGYSYSVPAGDTATTVKLARVCLLAPVVFIVGLLNARGEAKSGATKKVNYLQMFPTFVFGFLAFALAHTLGWLPTLHFAGPTWFSAPKTDPDLAKLLVKVSTWCIIISMAGVGLETRFHAMKQTGAKPFIAALIGVLVVAGLVLLAIRLIPIQ